MHIMSARALSQFISEANENRQRMDSTDHLDRVEYLPLLQRSLKFGLKTGFLCFVIFVFEILLYVRLSQDPSKISLAVTYIPLWILTLGSISNGIVCKSQHFIYVLIWVLITAAMVLSVLKIDYEMYQIEASYIIIVIQSMLGIISATLVYVINGHQIGYFKLSDSQLTAGVFYASSSFLAILLVAIMADTLPLPELIQLDFQLITVILAPMVVAMAGIGAYLVTRGEFDRLLKHGGQSAVIPMKLRLEADGWTSVESKGITSIPMFGDVRFVLCCCHDYAIVVYPQSCIILLSLRYEPLDQDATERLSIELCGLCCSACYPSEEEDEYDHHYHGRNTYQSPTPPTMAVSAQWGGGETIV
jgi:hypothetical protein